MTVADLYDVDFAEWTRKNAELLRSDRVTEADLAHIAEEIEDMGKRERRSLQRHFVRLIEHLLKWQYQPERRGSSWQRTIVAQRAEIQDILAENPSFRPTLPDTVRQAYERAATFASLATKQPRDQFPETCPYSLEQLLDRNFLP